MTNGGGSDDPSLRSGWTKLRSERSEESVEHRRCSNKKDEPSICGFNMTMAAAPMTPRYARGGLTTGLISGKRITSRIDGESVRIIVRRSIPIPSPAVGGIPYSRART